MEGRSKRSRYVEYGAEEVGPGRDEDVVEYVDVAPPSAKQLRRNALLDTAEEFDVPARRAVKKAKRAAKQALKEQDAAERAQYQSTDPAVRAALARTLLARARDERIVKTGKYQLHMKAARGESGYAEMRKKASKQQRKRAMQLLTPGILKADWNAQPAAYFDELGQRRQTEPHNLEPGTLPPPWVLDEATALRAYYSLPAEELEDVPPRALTPQAQAQIVDYAKHPIHELRKQYKEGGEPTLYYRRLQQLANYLNHRQLGYDEAGALQYRGPTGLHTRKRAEIKRIFGYGSKKQKSKNK